MLFILLVSSFEVGRFLQIVGLISLPVIAVTLSAVAWLHYRGKKQEENVFAADDPVFWIEKPKTLIPLDNQPPFVRDNTVLMLYNCRQELNTRQIMLEGLQEKYSQLQGLYEVHKKEINSNGPAIITTENVIEKAEENNLYKVEIIETETPNIQIQPMEKEIKSNETDYRYLQDMMQEKQLQIEFLQNQLSQRIRNFHEMESKEREVTEENKRMQLRCQELEDQAIKFREQFNLFENTNAKLRELQSKLDEQHKLINSQESAIGSMSKKLKQQHDLMMTVHNQLAETLKEEENTVIRLNTVQDEQEPETMFAVG